MARTAERELPKGVYKRGDTYWIRYTDASGKQQRERIIIDDGKSSTLADAERVLHDRRKAVYNGTFHPELNRTNPTFKEALDEVVNSALAKQKSGHKADLSRQKRILEYFKPDARIKGLTHRDVKQFINWLSTVEVEYGPPDESGARAKRPMSAESINHHYELLRRTVRATVGTSPTWNPFVDAERKPIKKLKTVGRDRVITPEEYKILLSGCESERFQQVRVAIQVAYHVGMRLGEVVNIHGAWLDEQNQMLRLPATHTKTDEARNVPLPRSVIQAIKALGVKEDGRFFVAKDANIISKSFTRLVRRVGLKDLHFHDLRHTAATNMRRKGVDVLTIKEICGWASMEMVERYNNINDDDLRAAMAKVVPE